LLQTILRALTDSIVSLGPLLSVKCSAVPESFRVAPCCTRVLHMAQAAIAL
jgi:hypothetical protein